MTGPPSEFEPPDYLLAIRYKWRLLQVRQLFRLSLEAFFFWTMLELREPRRSIDSLVNDFLDRVPRAPGAVNAGAWIHSLISPSDGPTELTARIERALDDPGAVDLPRSIALGLAFSLAEETPDLKQQYDRLPLSPRAEGSNGAVSLCVSNSQFSR